MTTNYQGMSHQELFVYANSGNPGSIDSNHSTISTYAADLDQATTDLSNTLKAIRQEWTGAASDTYFEQAQSVVTNMRNQVSNAQNTAKALATVYSALTEARQTMPRPPSEAERLLADVNNVPGLNVLAGTFSGGASYIESQMAQNDINASHQKAISTMNTLAYQYEVAQEQLPNVAYGTQPPSGGKSGGQQSSGYRSSGSSGGGVMAVPMILPPYAGSPISNPGGGGVVGSAKYPTGAGASGGVAPPTMGTGPGTGLQGGGGAAGGSGGGWTPTGPISGVGGAVGSGGVGVGVGAGVGGLGGPALGGAIGGGLGSVGAGGLFGANDTAGYGASGLAGGSGGTPAGESLAAADTLAASESAGSLGSSAGPGAMGSAGSAGGSVAGESPGGMVGGGMAGQGGMGAGSDEERRSRPDYLQQDKEYWYGDHDYAPPGGLIE